MKFKKSVAPIPARGSTLTSAKKVMRKLCTTCLAIVFLALLVVGIDRVSINSVARRARALRVGNSKQQVELLLGRPTKIFTPMPEARSNFIAALLSVSSETWAYGSRLDLHQPFHPAFPYFSLGDLIRLRLFKPEKDDIAIEFDSSGRISNITIP
jgi:hypothetical protein